MATRRSSPDPRVSASVSFDQPMRAKSRSVSASASFSSSSSSSSASIHTSTLASNSASVPSAARTFEVGNKRGALSVWQKPRAFSSSASSSKKTKKLARAIRVSRQKLARFREIYGSLQTWLNLSVAPPLMTMYFVLLLINTLLRDTKDTMLVTSSAGVEAIPLLKTWAVIPSSILFFALYSKLANALSKRSVFIVLIFGFAVWFILFSLFIFPLESRQEAILRFVIVPDRLAHFRPIVNNWQRSIFYIASELWASGICQLLFWSVCNDVVKLGQAKSLYPMIGLAGNMGMILAGRILLLFANERDARVKAFAYLVHQHNRSLHPIVRARQQQKLVATQRGDDQGWYGTLFLLSTMIAFCALLLTLLYDITIRRAVRCGSMAPPKRKRSASGELILPPGSPTRASSQKNSSPLRLVWRNRSLRSIALMVISYGMCSSLLEVTWKGKVKAAYEATEYSRFMGQCWTLTGAASIAMLLCGRTVLERFGYAFGVMFTPIVMAIAGCVFFLADDMAAYYGDDMSHSAAKVAAYAGGLAVVLSKAAKYSFFDATKEMAFIPLGAREKAIGKASIDVVAYRLAKSGGSFVLEFAVFAFGTLGSARASLFLTLVFIFVVIAWVYAGATAAKTLRTTVSAHPSLRTLPERREDAV